MSKSNGFFTCLLSMLSAVEAMTLCVLYSKCYHSTNIGSIAEKKSLTIMFIAGMLVFFIFFLLKRFPRFFPFAVKITAGNMVRQALLSRLFLSAISTLTTPIFICLIYIKYRSILYEPESVPYLSTAVPMIFGAACILCAIAYIITAIKKENNRPGEKN